MNYIAMLWREPGYLLGGFVLTTLWLIAHLPDAVPGLLAVALWVLGNDALRDREWGGDRDKPP